ncbi:MAG TPA: FAD-dependent oxidoreductase [Candidatus Limnocylindrales bacterium]|nr:FAD-dependent oxidoreductase [Candidatus Limnocylindrales bacterium]
MVAAQASGAGTKAVIAGAGPAGDAVAAGLRDAGFDGTIVLIGAEPEPPYERPHLSKGYLAGTVPREKLPLRPPQQYRDMQVDLVLGEHVVDFGIERRAVTTRSGKTFAWDLLCIATGSTARSLPGGFVLRSLQDADHLRRLIERRTSIHIVGAGFIGCEVAAVAVEKGCEVRVFEALEQPLVRVLGPELGAFLAAVHRGHGVDLRLNTQLPALDGPFLAAAGSEPQVFEAGLAGLRIERGIVVDELGRASAEGVFAAGDVTRFAHPLFATRIRVEHFQTSQRQGFAVGRAMAGQGKPFAEVPWFWSDQYDLNLQYAGVGLPWDEIVVRGDFGRPPFTVFYLGGGALLGVAGVNDHHTVARARHLMEAGRSISAQQLEDPTFDLRRALA